MSWDYRLIRHHYLGPNDEDLCYLSIHEVYYEDDGETPRACSAEPAELSLDVEDSDAATASKMMTALLKMQEAIGRPILDEGDF